jgi:hypothetical protein
VISFSPMSDKPTKPPGTGDTAGLHAGAGYSYTVDVAALGIPPPQAHITRGRRGLTGGQCFLWMAAFAFVFVILAGIGSALPAVSLSLPWGLNAVVRILGYALQAFAVVWFIALAFYAWHLFVKADHNLFVKDRDQTVLS